MTSRNILSRKCLLLTGSYSSLVIFSIITVLYFIWTWSPVLAQFGGDNATYFLTAKLFSPYSQPSDITEYFALDTPYPPLYPLVLALFGGGESILIAHLLTTSFLIAAIIVMYKWAVVMKLGNAHALVLVIIFAIIPGTYMQALSILSENLYLLLSLSALYLISFKENAGKWVWFTVLIIVCASLTRSAALPLVLCFIIYLFIKNTCNKYLLSLAAILPMIMWGIYNKQSSISYVTLFSEYYSTDFVSMLFQQVLDQTTYMLNVWHRTFTNGSSGHLLLSIFAIICVFGMVYSLYLKRMDGIYVLLYMLMILAWPYPAESMRLLYPVIPVLLVQASILVRDLTSSLSSIYGLHIGNIILEGILLIILVPNLILTISRFNVTVEDHLIPYKRTYNWYNPNPVVAKNEIRVTHGIISSLKEARKYVPEGQCAYSIKPSIVGLYLERISREPPVSSVDDKSFYEIIERSNCNYFYLLPYASPTYKEPFYPVQRMREYIDIIRIFYLDESNQQNIVAILAKLKK